MVYCYLKGSDFESFFSACLEQVYTLLYYPIMDKADSKVRELDSLSVKGWAHDYAMRIHPMQQVILSLTQPLAVC